MKHFLWILLFFLFGTLLVKAQDKVEKLTSTDIPTSKALPAGMKLAWNDEFNKQELDHTKWWNRYFSSLDWFNKKAYEAFRSNTLPEADYEFTGNSIILKATDKLYPGSERQISSIQTYDWETNTNKMDNALGGFFEARIRRDIGEKGGKVNIAFWFDSPGPDLKYYLEKGGNVSGTDGIRPRGQLFEIDMCEYITTEIVLHGNVAPDGKFQRNIGHYIHKGDFKGEWVTHSVLWTPAGLKFYIDGELIREWWDKNDIKSPNHAMNMFFGAYGINDVTMEVDYVRYYQWELEEGNHIPNSGFEYSGKLFPWEGTGQIDTGSARSGKNALKLMPGATIEQYIYLDHSRNYELGFWTKGEGDLIAKAENITQVSGISEGGDELKCTPTNDYRMQKLSFTSNPEPVDNKRTVKISFTNTGNSEVFIDDIVVSEK